MSKPNILLVITDQQRADSLGHAHPGPSYTPTLDQLAGEGVLFENAYAGATTCVPSRSALFTGILPHRLPTVEGGLALPEGYWTVARALQGAGYRTGLLGKSHFEPVRADHGFDVLRTCEHLTAPAGYGPDVTDDYREWLRGKGKRDVRFRRPSEPVRFAYDAEFHPTSWVTREAIEFLQRGSRDQPFFAMVSYPNPHTPYDPPEPYASMYPPDEIELPGSGIEVHDGLPQPFLDAVHDDPPGGFFAPKRVDKLGEDRCRAVLAAIRALVRQIDDAVGELMGHVDLSDTLVFFVSDHGDYGGHRGLMAKIPWLPFDDLLRVPFFCLGAGVRGGRRVEAPVRAFDFALTALEVAGVDPPDADFDSVSLRPVLAGAEPDAERPVVSNPTLGFPMIRRGRYKHMLHVPTDSHVLFDLIADPGETRNLADDPVHADLLRETGVTLHRVLSKEPPELWVRRPRRGGGRLLDRIRAGLGRVGGRGE